LYLAGRDAPVKAELASATKALATVSQQEGALRTEQNQQLQLVHEIRAQNIPWTNVLRFLSQAVPTSVGLTSVTANGPTLSIQGDSLSPGAITAFWSQMQSSPFFVNTNLTSSTDNNGKITFNMTATLPPPVDAAAAANQAIQRGAPRFALADIQRLLALTAGKGVAVARVTARGALLSIVGQSTSDEAVMSFWTAMQRSAVFGQPTVTQLRRDNGSIFFEMTAVLPGPIVGADAGDGR
jgi:Tfp pilus assembly protein PilN